MSETNEGPRRNRVETPYVFDDRNLTPLEQMFHGGTVAVNGEHIFVDPLLEAVRQNDADARRILLTPINLAEGKKTREQVIQERLRERNTPTMIGQLVLISPEARTAVAEADMQLNVEPSDVLDSNEVVPEWKIRLIANRTGTPIKNVRVRNKLAIDAFDQENFSLVLPPADDPDQGYVILRLQL